MSIQPPVPWTPMRLGIELTQLKERVTALEEGAYTDGFTAGYKKALENVNSGETTPAIQGRIENLERCIYWLTMVAMQVPMVTIQEKARPSLEENNERVVARGEGA